MQTQVLSDPELMEKLDQVFGRPSDPMVEVDRRAQSLLSDYNVVVWEGDAATFHFSFVSPSASLLLGHDSSRWTTEPTFWADVVVHPEDRNDAIGFCALATGQARDHDFVYRAVAADGSVIRLHDIVRVITGTRGVPERLRGVMIQLPEEQ
jgi:PAS domain-containing protein